MRNYSTKLFEMDTKWAIIILFLLGMAIRIPYSLIIYSTGEYLHSDSITYLGPAESLLKEGNFKYYNGDLMFHRTPGYPIFLAGLLRITNNNYKWLLIVQNTIFVFIAIILYLIARFTLPKQYAFLAGVLIQLSPWQTVYSSAILTDSLSLFILSIIFLMVILLKRNISKPTILFTLSIVLGLLMACYVLVRPVVPLLILMLGFVWFYLGYSKKILGVVCVVLIFSLSPILIWSVRNNNLFGTYALSHVSWSTAYKYWGLRTYAMATAQDKWADTTKLKYNNLWDEPIAGNTVKKSLNNYKERTIEIISQYPTKAALGFLLSNVETMLHPDPSILRRIGVKIQYDMIIFGALWFMMLSISVFGLYYIYFNIKTKINIDCDFILGMLMVCLLLSATLGISFGAGARLRMPMELIISILSSVGIISILGKRIN